MGKPMIGVMPLVDTEKESYWMLPGYMGGIIDAGGIPVMLPLTSDEEMLTRLVSEFDGFLFTGGQDVSPELYGERRSSACGEVCDKRDEMEKIVFRKAYEQDKPVLGICRGIQFINVAMGGTLYQDLPTEHPSDTEHHQNPPYEKPVHSVKLFADSPLHELLGVENMHVNSYHHQAVKELGDNLNVMAVSEDGLVEAICVPNRKYIWALQWHPEFSFHCDEHSRKIFKSFVNAAL